MVDIILLLLTQGISRAVSDVCLVNERAATTMERSCSSRSFTIDWSQNCFLKDGQPFRYISGSMHYFRVPSAYWEDRLRKMKAAGLNAVETYVAWHVHEPKEGVLTFEEEADLFKFLHLAQKVGLLVIVRPGPFIDAERDFGGFPGWLLHYKDIKLRTSDPVYMEKVGKWFSHLLPRLKEFLYENGGPIITMQVENEYGSFYACDKVYLRFLKGLLEKHLGTNLVLFTVDTAFSEKEILCGGLDDVFKTVDFGANTDISTAFDILRKIQPTGPLVNSEFYTGWLDHWGEEHQTRPTELVASALDKLLSLNASVNFYMFEGGTNFAFSNGAEIMKTGRYAPEPTSYDYDAPLSESGDLTEKYDAIRTVIAKYEPQQIGDSPVLVPKRSYGTVKITKWISLFDALSVLHPHGPVLRHNPPSMEDLNQAFGYMLYRTQISGLQGPHLQLTVETIRDRATVFVDKVFQGSFDRNSNPGVSMQPGATLDILVENQGRVNYKYGDFVQLQDPKGILGNVTINGQTVHSWEVFPLPLDDLKKLAGHLKTSKDIGSPGVFVGTFSSPEPGDTFLKTKQWTKGQAFVNGFNIGRYWPAAGPQLTLYVPGCLLHHPPSENEVLLFETDGVSCNELSECYVEFVSQPEWKSFP